MQPLDEFDIMASVRPINPTSGSVPQTLTCPKCGASASQSLRHCPTCENDLGFPNVRAAAAPSEVNALSNRYKVARDQARDRGLGTQFDELVAAVNSESHVVVAMRPLFVRQFLADPRTLYAGYENLVGGGNRVPAPFEQDSDRFAVSGKLFASYASDIRYGVLSLDGVGLKNYGLVFVRLRDVAIEQRVSFLHENSYLFLDNLNMPVRSELPLGFRSTWRNRAELVAAKIEPNLTAVTSSRDWSCHLVFQGTTRPDDRCVEAHIFGSFNIDSIQSIEFSGPGSSREEKNDIAIIKELMAKRGLAGGKA